MRDPTADLSRPLLLATDLDGTFAGGTPEARRELQRALRAAPTATVVYVTGRSVQATHEIIAQSPLPTPDLLIADVGTSVVRGEDFEPIAEIQEAIHRRWPGAAAVRERIAGLEGVEEQDVIAPDRLSYWLRQGEMDAILDRMADRLRDLDVDLVGSADTYIDVLPSGVNKGSTLLRVLDWLSVPAADVVVAGDTLNDLALFETGLRGVVVANCEPGLRDCLIGRDHVYFAAHEGAAGVLEGLRHFGCLTGESHAE